MIKGDGCNVRAYIGVAKCFEKMGRFDKEAEIWNLICSILQKQRASGTDEMSSLDIVEIIVSILFPFKLLGLAEALLMFARKCFKLAEYHNSAEKFLDVLALISAGDIIPEYIDLIELKQEAALALLIVGNISEALLICQDLVIAKKVGGKRKESDGKRNEVVLKFLLAKCYFLKGDYDASLQYFDQSLRSCLAEMTEKSRGKVGKCEGLEESDSENYMLSKMVRIRARLYYEKALVYRKLMIYILSKWQSKVR